MNNTDKTISNIVYVSIGLLTAFFTSRLYDIVNNYEQLQYIKCARLKQFEYSNQDTEYNECYENKTKSIETYDKTKLTYMLVIGFMLLVFGIISYKYLGSNVSSNGVSLGGLFLLIYFIVANWSKFNNVHQVMLIGTILGSLLLFGLSGKIL